MEVNSQNVYLDVVTTLNLPQGISMVPLSQLALAFSQMAKSLRNEQAPAEQQEAFQSAIADAANSAPHLTSDERTAVKNTVFTAFDGLPRNHTVQVVRAEFLRQVTFPRSTERPFGKQVRATFPVTGSVVRRIPIARTSARVA